MRNFGSPYGRYWMVRPSSSLAASEAGQGAPKSRSTPCHTNSTAQSPRSASKSARTRSTWQGRTSVMRCTAKQAQARNQVSLHAIRAGEGGREFRQSPPFERFAAYRRATTSRELCSARFLLSRCPLWVKSCTSVPTWGRFISAVPPVAEVNLIRQRLQRCAKSGLTHCSKLHRYSITSSAMASNDGGTAMPSILAVWSLMTSSNLDACTTGRSAGLAPLRMRPA